MKTIIKNTLIAIALLVASQSYAQHEITEMPVSPPKVTFGVRAGLNLSNLTSYHDGKTYNEKLRVAYNIGAIMDCHLAKDFYLRTGLSIASKGAKVEDITMEGFSGKLEGKMEAVYLQLPLYFTYKTAMPRNPNYKLSIAGGPFFAYGIAGDSKYYNRAGGLEGTGDTFGDNALWNRPDIGIGMEVTFEMQKLVFAIGSEMGLAKAWKTEYLTENIHVRNNTSYISVGYNF